MHPVSGATLIGRGTRKLHRGGVRVGLLVGDLGMHDDQPRLVGVGDVAVVLRADMHPREVAASAPLVSSRRTTSAQTSSTCSRSAWSLARRVMLACRSYQYLPGPGVEVRRPVPQRRQRGVEVARDVAGDGGAEEHPLSFQTLVRRPDGRGGTEEDGPGQPLGDPAGLQQRLLVVDLGRLGVRAVDVGVDDRLPLSPAGTAPARSSPLPPRAGWSRA